MSLDTQYRTWTVQGNAAGSATYMASVGLFNYRLSAFDVVPGTTPRGQPFVVAAPTMTRGNVRERVAGSPSTEVSPQERIISGVTSPAIRNRFSLSFIGAGAGPGIPLGGTISTPSDPSSTSRVAFFGPSRSAMDFRSPGVVLDGGITIPYSSSTVGVQILLINFATEIVGGTIAFARHLQGALSGRGWNVQDIFGFLNSMVTPDTAIAVIGGYGHGVAAGLTIYGGGFRTE